MSTNPEHDDWVLPDRPPVAGFSTTRPAGRPAAVTVGPDRFTFRRKIAVAVTAVTLVTVGLVVSLAGAGTPWYCRLGPPTGAVCHVVAIGNDTGRVVDHTANAAEHTADATASAAGLLDKATQAAAGALDWANRQAANIPRRMQPGECVDTTTGRYCVPVAEQTSPTTTTTPTTSGPARYCYITKSGVRVCVR